MISPTKQRGYNLLRVLDSASCDTITYETRGYDLLRALGSASCDLTHARDKAYDLLRALGPASGDHTRRGGAICHWHCFESCEITHETGGAICFGLCVLYLVISPTKQRGDDLLRALGSASCDITHDTGVRFVTGIVFCVL